MHHAARLEGLCELRNLLLGFSHSSFLMAENPCSVIKCSLLSLICKHEKGNAG